MSNPSSNWPVSVPFESNSPPSSEGIEWNGNGALRFPTGNSGTAELARSLLKHDEVRSVVVDRKSGQATVHLNASHPTEEVLQELVSIAGNPQAAPADCGNSDRELPEVASWPDAANQREGYFRAPVMATGWRRILLLLGAGLTFVLAMIGTILPGIPTTPFLLLTSYCLLRSSTRLHDRLLRSRTFGWLLRDWHMHRGVRPGVKTKSLVILAVFLGATMIFSGLPAWLLVVIACFASIGVWCILRLKVIADSDSSFQAIRFEQRS